MVAINRCIDLSWCSKVIGSVKPSIASSICWTTIRIRSTSFSWPIRTRTKLFDTWWPVTDSIDYVNICFQHSLSHRLHSQPSVPNHMNSPKQTILYTEFNTKQEWLIKQHEKQYGGCYDNPIMKTSIWSTSWEILELKSLLPMLKPQKADSKKSSLTWWTHWVLWAT